MKNLKLFLVLSLTSISSLSALAVPMSMARKQAQVAEQFPAPGALLIPPLMATPPPGPGMPQPAPPPALPPTPPPPPGVPYPGTTLPNSPY